MFDDRIEIRSCGRLPTGVTVEQLSGRHDSKPTNPLIAGAFHRTGAVEVWGRGTNRVITMCKQNAVAAPVFEDRHGFLIVTFKAQMVAPGRRVESQPESQPESLTQRVLLLLKSQTSGKAEITANFGQKAVSGQLNKVVRDLLAHGLVEHTIPDKPNSRLQKYRLTAAGQRALDERSREGAK